MVYIPEENNEKEGLQGILKSLESQLKQQVEQDKHTETEPLQMTTTPCLVSDLEEGDIVQFTGSALPFIKEGKMLEGLLVRLVNDKTGELANHPELAKNEIEGTGNVFMLLCPDPTGSAMIRIRAEPGAEVRRAKGISRTRLMAKMLHLNLALSMLEG